MPETLKISIAGTGNVAFHLGKALSKICTVEFVLGRNERKGKFLAEQLNSTFTANAEDLSGSDLIVCCYSDDSLKIEISRLSELAPVASTSGTVDVLSFQHKNPTGVFYPLQSFSGMEDISLNNIPFFIEASSDELKNLLFTLAKSLNAKPVEMNAADRVKLHVTAVFTNNFTNHILDLAQHFAAENGIDYNYLLPLLDKTVERLHHHSAAESQTGPAKRNDQETINKHLSLLDGDMKKIYQLLSESIQKHTL